LIIIHRKTYDIHLALRDVTDETMGIYSHTKGCTGRPVFLAGLTDLFPLEVVRRREAMRSEGGSVLIIDNCTARAEP
jgi:hypothetical protein